MQQLFVKHELKEQPILEIEKFEGLTNRLHLDFYSTQDGPNVLLSSDKGLVKKIRDKTAEDNLNNLTRTKAYLDYYRRNPEIHWAFLAHMVSRNGGYHMTDLRGSAMDHLFTESEKETYFIFLERANSAIFADAYPQLLLYEEAKRKPLSLRSLLPIFHVSRFMYSIWDLFLKEGNSKMLTIALIINEQRMIEDRIIKRFGHAELLSRLDFQLQEFFGFTTVIFPYKQRLGRPYQLTGLSVERFADPAMRILTGKKLYSLLFDKKDVLEGVSKFSINTEHTASRSDYWKTIFTNSLAERGKKIYSPVLTSAWNDRPFEAGTHSDWFIHKDFIEDLRTEVIMKHEDITDKVKNNLAAIKVINEIKSVI
ncbi:DUF2515 family protein [Peribacillus deserti]|uniref:DUF2515 domain-containing protein n=1 Tax=Peribacillus deserti TaxID=673318 RepID=A0A2N5MA33_9BACI|nr:DUF2515 family protein [Peribacillus deserti]PLT31214.1 DUF2515 domain-containing protein [Peribacillus deserti]